MDITKIPKKFYREATEDAGFPRAHNVKTLIAVLTELPADLPLTYDPENERLVIHMVNMKLDNPHVSFEEIGAETDPDGGLTATNVGELITQLNVLPENLDLHHREYYQMEVITYNVFLSNPHLSLNEIEIID